MRKEVVAYVDRTLVAKMVGEYLVVVVLAHVASHRVGADREFAELAATDQEPVTRVVDAPGLDRPRRGAPRLRRTDSLLRLPDSRHLWRHRRPRGRRRHNWRGGRNRRRHAALGCQLPLQFLDRRVALCKLLLHRRLLGFEPLQSLLEG